VFYTYNLVCITGPPNGPVLPCSLASVVCLRRLSSFASLQAGGRASRRARGRSGGRHCTAGQYGSVSDQVHGKCDNVSEAMLDYYYRLLM